MDGLMDGQLDEWTMGGWAEMGGLTDGQMDECTDMDRWMVRLMDGLIDKWTQMHGWTDGQWLDG